MKIHGLNKTTLLDYPEHLACTVFTGHCNFACPFCHNGDLVLYPESQPEIPEEEFFSFLKKRSGVLEGVCITGGEPTLHKDLPEFIDRIRSMDLYVKLDSNGTNPAMLKELIDNDLINMAAMDIKSSKADYPLVAGKPGFDISPVEESVALLMEGHIPYEFRTTVVKELHNRQSFTDIADWIKGCSSYFLQTYVPEDRILINCLKDNSLREKYPEGFSAYNPEEMKEFADLLNSLGVNTKTRGI